MKWIAIAGGWRKINQQVSDDVRRTVRDIIQSGDGIISGGALGVDFIATDEALKLNTTATQIRIFLPVTLERYIIHYRKRADEGVITHEQAELLIEQLIKLKSANPNALIENTDNETVGKEAYFERITQIVAEADELVAFHINQTEGTQNTINKAEKRGVSTEIFTYTIE